MGKNTKKDRTQKVTENARPKQTPFTSSHINQILYAGSYPGYLSWFQVSLRSVKKCGSCGGQNFGLPIDLAHRLYGDAEIARPDIARLENVRPCSKGGHRET